MASRSILPVITALLLACSSPIRAAPATDGGQDAPSVTTVLKDRQGRSGGKVTVTEPPHGRLLRGGVEGLAPGTHAIHFHEAGKCEAPFTSAGAHFNPSQKAHGMLSPTGPHAGDLPNLVVPASGKLDFELFAPGLTLGSGPAAVPDTDRAGLPPHH